MKGMKKKKCKVPRKGAKYSELMKKKYKEYKKPSSKKYSRKAKNKKSLKNRKGY
jgi:hypothetical protein